MRIDLYASIYGTTGSTHSSALIQLDDNCITPLSWYSARLSHDPHDQVHLYSKYYRLPFNNVMPNNITNIFVAFAACGNTVHICPHNEFTARLICISRLGWYPSKHLGIDLYDSYPHCFCSGAQSTVYDVVPLSPPCRTRDLPPSSNAPRFFSFFVPVGCIKELCHVMLLLGLLNVCNIHVHILFFSKTSVGSWFAIFHRSSFFILSEPLHSQISWYEYLNLTDQ